MFIEEIAWRDPLDVFTPLAGEPHAHLLHAGARAIEPGWSVIVSRPADFVEFSSGRVSVNGDYVAGDPFKVLDNFAKSRKCSISPEDDLALCPFLSGAVGFIGYEVGGLIEPTASGPPSPFAFSDIAFGFYDAAIVFDRGKRRCFLVASSRRNASPLYDIVSSPHAGNSSVYTAERVISNFSEQLYKQAVSEVIEKILKGDIFQANISQQLSASIKGGDVFQLFQSLSEKSEAPFGAYLQYKEGVIVSNSPERFFRVDPEGDLLKIRMEPIKGTKPRGDTKEEDEKLAQTLLNDEKERAENIMIADLVRNDLSRICEDQSIQEEAICRLVSYASVHHMVSIISGVLKEGVTIVDAIKALFPCGSITGAPKIEAMKVIASAEKQGRGPYCGAIGYIDDRGGADFSVSIRTMMATPLESPSAVVFPVGGGITVRSQPKDEYEETLVKGRSFLQALSLKGMRPE